MIMIIILNEVIMFPLVKIQLNSNQFVLSKINYVVKDLNSLSLVFYIISGQKRRNRCEKTLLEFFVTLFWGKMEVAEVRKHF